MVILARSTGSEQVWGTTAGEPAQRTVLSPWAIWPLLSADASGLTGTISSVSLSIQAIKPTYSYCAQNWQAR